MFEATLAGSLPKPGWLAETHKLWPHWKLAGDALAEAKRDATLLWLKDQEDAGIDVVGDGEHGFLEAVEGIDFEQKVKITHPRQPPRCDGAAGHRAATARATGARGGGLARARTRGSGSSSPSPAR